MNDSISYQINALQKPECILQLRKLVIDKLIKDKPVRFLEKRYIHSLLVALKISMSHLVINITTYSKVKIIISLPQT